MAKFLPGGFAADPTDYPYDPFTTVALFGCRAREMRGCIPPSQTEELFYLSLEMRLLTVIEALYAHGYRTFLTALADGFDLFAALIVIRLKVRFPEIRLIAVRPYTALACDPGFRRMRDAVCEQLVYTEDFCRGIGPDDFLLRDDFMLQNCSCVLCFFVTKRSAIYQTLRNAVYPGRTMINLWLMP